MRSLLESGNGELHLGHLKAVVVYIPAAVPRSQIVLLDSKRVVGLLSPKATFILAWGNAPGLGVRFPGAMPLENYGDYGRWPIGVPVDLI